MKVSTLIGRNIVRNPRNFAFASTGIVLGISAFVFFIALGHGVRVNVLERVFVVDQLEVVPRTVEVGAFESRGLFAGSGTGLDDYTIEDISAIEGVQAVLPRQHIAFPAYANGGEAILGDSFWTEFIGDGIPPDLVADRFNTDDPARAFVDHDLPRACTDGDACAPGSDCLDGVCVPRSCVPDDEIWAGPDERALGRLADRVARETDIRRRHLQVRDLGEAAPPSERYRLYVAVSGVDEAADALADVDDAPGTRLDPARAGCDDAPAYCQAEDRVCRMPVPVLVSYTLLELYNGNVQSVLQGSSSGRSLPRMTEDALVGFGFNAVLGRGFLGDSVGSDESDVPVRHLRLRIVGFSDRAMPIGATVPITYVQRWNALYGADRADDTWDSLLVVTDDSRSLHRVAHAITEDLELSLDESYDQSRRASLMITIVTGVLALLSVLIVVLAALNIMHTFLMVIAERRREIGVLRAVGASRGHVYALVLAEAALIAVVSAAIAWGLAAIAMHFVDQAFVSSTPDFPFKPEHLFSVPSWLPLASFGIALVFCIFGAALPARRAARLDPAEALRTG